MECDLMVAFGRDFSQVVIPAFTRVEPEPWAGLAEQHVPGAFDIFRRKGLSIVPLDARAKLKGYYRPFVAPRPFLGEVRHNGRQAVLRDILLVEHQIVEYRHARH